jgi:hypothetical protein
MPTKVGRFYYFENYFQKCFEMRKQCEYLWAKRKRKTRETFIFRVKAAKRMQANMAHEIDSEITANDLAQKLGKGVDGIRIKYSRLFAEGHPLFVASFDRHAPLSPEQIQILAPEKRGQKASIPKAGKKTGAGTTAPALLSKTGFWRITPLLVAFILPTVASLGNTYRVSHYLSNDATTSLSIMLVMSCVPLLFLWAGVGKWVSIGAAVWLVLFEAFCNLSATYLALMGGMTYVFGQPRGECSKFLESVCRLTESGYQWTAFALGLAVAFSLLAAQLTAFYELKKRV